MAGSLIAASLWRGSSFARTARADSTATTQPAGQPTATQSFGQFDSYTLGLLLGGLRGPLVMTLWSSSETQKSERNLEDINTKIELIGLLQPEFDAVHLFQIWNKAYNLSVQMSNLSGKYSTILDAIDYANKRRLDRGQNINLESALASVYFDKLGNSSEKTYYRERVRDETIAPLGQVQFVFPSARRDEFVKLALDAGADARRYSIRPEGGADDLLTARLRADYAERIVDKFKGEKITSTRLEPRTTKLGTGSIRSSMDPVLDSQGRILPAYITRDENHKVGDMDWPQNGELSYLAKFEPYPYGLSPYAFAYNYYKRAVALQETMKQRHAQLSERVISSRPALSLKSWSEEELERGRLAEMAQYGLAPLPESQSALPNELPAANLPLEAIKKTPLIDEATYCYQRSAMLATAAIQEYRLHLERYREDSSTYVSHMAHTMALGELATGDALYLEAALAQGGERTRLGQMAMDHYRRALDLLSLNVLAFFAPDEMLAAAMPKGYGKIDAMNAFDNPAAFPADQIAPTISKIYQLGETPEFQGVSEITEYRTYSSRAVVRLEALRAALNQ
jgi:hypothetical protein